VRLIRVRLKLRQSSQRVGSILRKERACSCPVGIGQIFNGHGHGYGFLWRSVPAWTSCTGDTAVRVECPLSVELARIMWRSGQWASRQRVGVGVSVVNPQFGTPIRLHVVA
jgi:hypothetical protein